MYILKFPVTKAYAYNFVVIITGAGQHSIGGQTALDLAQGRPKELILVSRKESTVISVVNKIGIIDPSITVRFIQMDLDSLDSVRKAAAEINENTSQIDAIINNAAIMGTPWAVTKEGIEMQFGVNHIGHFLFTNLLIPKIPFGGRIVNVSSSGHCMSGIRFDDYNFQNGKVYDEWDAYGQAKTANVLFSIELARRLKGRNIQSFSLHPANTSSGLSAHLENPDWTKIHEKFRGKRVFEGELLRVLTFLQITLYRLRKRGLKHQRPNWQRHLTQDSQVTWHYHLIQALTLITCSILRSVSQRLRTIPAS